MILITWLVSLFQTTTSFGPKVQSCIHLLDILQINISKYNLKLVTVTIRGLDQSRPVLDCDIVRRRRGTGTKYPLSSPHVKTCLIRQTLNWVSAIPPLKLFAYLRIENFSSGSASCDMSIVIPIHTFLNVYSFVVCTDIHWTYHYK